MLGVVNTDLLKYFLEESYSIEKRTEYLTKIQSLNDDEVTEALIDDALDNMFRFRVKRDPGLRYHIYSEVKDDKKFQKRIRSIIFQLYGSTVESGYTFEPPNMPLSGKWDADVQKRFKTPYFRYRLEDAKEKSESNELILAISTLLYEHENSKYNPAYMAENDLKMHVTQNNSITSSVMCTEYLQKNIRIFERYQRHTEPDSINANLLVPSFIHDICLAIFEIDTSLDSKNNTSQPKDDITLFKFMEDLTIIICNEWFISLDRAKKIECLNKVYPFKREHVKSLLDEMKKKRINNEFAHYNLAEIMLKSGRYDLALEYCTYHYNNTKRFNFAQKVGQTYREQGKYEKALEWYNKAKSAAKKANFPAYEIRVNIAEMKYRLDENDLSLKEYLKELEGIYDEAYKNDEKEYRLYALLRITQSCRRVEQYDRELKYLKDLLQILSELINDCRNGYNNHDLFTFSIINEGREFNKASNIYSKYADDAKKRMKELTDHSCRFDELRNLDLKLNHDKYVEFYNNDLGCFQFERAKYTAQKLLKLDPNDPIWYDYIKLSYTLCTNPKDRLNFCNNCLNSQSNGNKELFLKLLVSMSITECEGKITDEVKSELKYIAEYLLTDITEIKNKVNNLFDLILPIVDLWENDDLKMLYLDTVTEIFDKTGISIFLDMPIESAIANRAKVNFIYNTAETFFEKSISYQEYDHEFDYMSLIDLKGIFNKSDEANEIFEKAISQTKFPDSPKYYDSFPIRISMSYIYLNEAEYDNAQKCLDEAEKLMRDTNDINEILMAEIIKFSRLSADTIKLLGASFDDYFEIIEHNWKNLELPDEIIHEAICISDHCTQIIDQNRFIIFDARNDAKKSAEMINHNLNSFKKEYISFKKINSPVAHSMMKTGDHQYFNAYKNQQDDDELDYSPIIIQYGKAIERLLNDTVTRHLRDCLQPDEIKGLRKGLQHIFGDAKKSVSLGIWHEFYANLPKIKNKNLSDKLCNEYYSLLSKEDRENLGKYCSRLAELRNGAAHITFNSKEDVDEQRKKVVDLINSIIAITAKIPSQ